MISKCSKFKAHLKWLNLINTRMLVRSQIPHKRALTNLSYTTTHDKALNLKNMETISSLQVVKKIKKKYLRYHLSIMISLNKWCPKRKKSKFITQRMDREYIPISRSYQKWHQRSLLWKRGSSPRNSLKMNPQLNQHPETKNKINSKIRTLKS